MFFGPPVKVCGLDVDTKKRSVARATFASSRPVIINIRDLFIVKYFFRFAQGNIFYNFLNVIDFPKIEHASLTYLNPYFLLHSDSLPKRYDSL